MTKYTGVNIQWPISEAILDGTKSIETRTYPLPERYLGKEMLLIETPGKKGKFKSRITAIIIFTSCKQYKNRTEFDKDYSKHLVDKKSEWYWSTKPKYGWEVKVIKKFSPPIPYTKRKGIKFTLNISI